MFLLGIVSPVTYITDLLAPLTLNFITKVYLTFLRLYSYFTQLSNVIVSDYYLIFKIFQFTTL